VDSLIHPVHHAEEEKSRKVSNHEKGDKKKKEGKKSKQGAADAVISKEQKSNDGRKEGIDHKAKSEKVPQYAKKQEAESKHPKSKHEETKQPVQKHESAPPVKQKPALKPKVSTGDQYHPSIVLVSPPFLLHSDTVAKLHEEFAYIEKEVLHEDNLQRVEESGKPNLVHIFALEHLRHFPSERVAYVLYRADAEGVD